ncbi:MAG: alanine--tRNA ligase [Candidatus Yanofskybacteria bacterium]|nr:alanine--tRNA ligase [Candidatus Yanofskybacteria bacterium]
MTHFEIREKFLKFFEERGHKRVPSSSLLPTDPSVLFTTAGMQQFKPYYTGEADPMKDFGLLNTTSIQKCIRTSDIDEVGDESHLTFFEMLGNFSFGGYWKKEAIEYAHEFITKEMGLEIDYVSVFGGADMNEIFEFKKIKADFVPADKDSEQIWKKIDPNVKIRVKNGFEGLRDNFWGPTGDEGPCGPTTEIYVKGVEIWNIVFNEYNCTKDFKFEPLKKRGIDTGMGLERLAMAAQKKNNIFETDLLAPVINATPQDMDIGVRRIITDHMRAAVFMISDGIMPSNKEAGYVLRKLIRRIMTYSYLYLTSKQRDTAFNYEDLIKITYDNYENFYKNLEIENIRDIVRSEYVKFNDALAQGTAELKKFFSKFISGVDAQNPGNITITNNMISGKGLGLELFKIYESRGLHPDIARDILQQWGLNLDPSVVDEYKLAIQEAELKHKEISRAGVEKKFGGHGLILDTGELKAGDEEELAKVTRLHTATHLLHASLRKVLGEGIQQAGSDITAERLRFDFTFPRKMTEEEIKKVENTVNEAIAQDLPVTMEEMPYEEAIKKGALAFFKLKYPPIVKVFTIGPKSMSDPSSSSGLPFSQELCGGPHVTNTGAIGKFKITKEESISAGTRRIRATVEK